MIVLLYIIMDKNVFIFCKNFYIFRWYFIFISLIVDYILKIK